eukprot:scaffold274899_cov46-Prasinocladus_malaysianus.AAC.1
MEEWMDAASHLLALCIPGLYAVKEELEETSFRYSDPEAYSSLKRRVDAIKAEQEPAIQQARQALSDILNEDVYLKMRVDRIQVVPAYKSLYVMHKKSGGANSGTGNSADSLKPLGNVSQLHVIIHEKTGDVSLLPPLSRSSESLEALNFLSGGAYAVIFAI